MARKKTQSTGHQIHESSAEGLGEAQATAVGTDFTWHYGRLTGLGSYDMLEGGRGVTIVWEEGGASSYYGAITDPQWEVFKLAFAAAGRVAVLSDQEGEGWMYDYRYLEALR